MNVSGERVRIGAWGRFVLRWYDAERELLVWPRYVGFSFDSVVSKAWRWLIGWPMVVEVSYLIDSQLYFEKATLFIIQGSKV